MTTELEFDDCRFLLHVRVRQHIHSFPFNINRTNRSALCEGPSYSPSPLFNIHLEFLLLQESLHSICYSLRC